MLIIRWPRTRCLPNRSFRSLQEHIFQGHHTTATHIRSASSKRIVQPLYIDTVPPTSDQLHASEFFFKTHLPTKSWTATEWRQQPHSESTYLVPEVAFLGRSNSGKSSLLNGLLFDDKLCRVGAKPGKTITMHAWSLSPIDPTTRGARKGYKGDMEPKLTVLDMPGYGHGSHGEWGAAIMKYLTSRRQLRRAFVLINPLHGLKKQDLQMLELLRSHGIPHQLIACKSDKLKATDAQVVFGSIQAEIDAYFDKKRKTPLLMTIKDILPVGGLAEVKDSSKWLDSAQGLHDVRWAILRAAGLNEYAMTLAANGGKMPKTQIAQTSQIDQATFAHQNPTKQTGSESPIRDGSHESHVGFEPPDYDLEPAPSQSHFTPQTSSIDISVEELLSDNFNPPSCHSDSSKSNPADAKEYVKLGGNHLVGRAAAAYRRNTPPRQRVSAAPAAVRSRQSDSRKGKVIPDGRTSRTKDVKRYGAGKR